MLEKYKKMGLAAAACTLLGVSASEAAVTLTFSQVGSDVVATWSGSYDARGIVSTASFFTNPPGNGYLEGGLYAVGFLGNWSYLKGAGQFFSLAGVPAQDVGYVGESFGFDREKLVVATSRVGTLFAPSGTMTFRSSTLGSLGVAGLSNFLAYQGSNNVGSASQIFLTTSGGSAGASRVPDSGTTLAMLGVSLGLVGFAHRKLKGNFSFR